MFTLTITEKGGEPQVENFEQPEITIGRVQGNDIVLAKTNISKRHARIIDNDGSYVVVDSKSTNGTYINGKRIDAPYDICEGDKIYVGDYTLEIQQPGRSSPPPPPDAESPLALDDGLLGSDEWDDDWGGGNSSGGFSQGETQVQDESADLSPDPGPDLAFDPDPALDSSLDPDPSSGGITVEPDQAPVEEVSSASSSAGAPIARRIQPGLHTVEPLAPRAMVHEHSSVAREVHERLLRSLALRQDSGEPEDEGAKRDRIRESVQDIIAAMGDAGELPKSVSIAELTEEVLDEALAVGPLADLLADDLISEIMVNGPSDIFVKRDGRVERCERKFSSAEAVIRAIERIIVPVGGHIDSMSPMIDMRLADGGRVSAIIPPLAVDGPILTIRKFSNEPLTVDDLVGAGTFTAEMSDFLEICVKARRNILVSGGTRSGKTATLNVLSGFLPEDERIITIEEIAELKLEQPHVVRLEARPADFEGRGEVGLRRLLRTAQRMRPDRLVVGECRGAEAADLVQAMNSGHDGSLTTVHAASPQKALARLENLVMMSEVLPPGPATREHLATAVHLIVQQACFADGSRRVTHISEVTGIESHVIAVEDIFVFEQDGFDKSGKLQGSFRPTGVTPKFYDDLKAMGISHNRGIFKE